MAKVNLLGPLIIQNLFAWRGFIECFLVYKLLNDWVDCSAMETCPTSRVTKVSDIAPSRKPHQILYAFLHFYEVSYHASLIASHTRCKLRDYDSN